MIRINFRKKISKEDDLASEVVEILEEKMDERKIKIPESMLDSSDEQLRFREDLRKELVYEISDFLSMNRRLLVKKVA